MNAKVIADIRRASAEHEFWSKAIDDIPDADLWAMSQPYQREPPPLIVAHIIVQLMQATDESR